MTRDQRQNWSFFLKPGLGSVVVGLLLLLGSGFMDRASAIEHTVFLPLLTLGLLGQVLETLVRVNH